MSGVYQYILQLGKRRVAHGSYMGTATLGFAGGPSVAFRLDPEDIEWDFQIITNVIETVGGRVIQVIGSYLNNLAVTGSFGQDHRAAAPDDESWVQAQAFLQLITAMMEYQSQDANQQELMSPPAVFTYPPKNYRFQVYIDSLTDATDPIGSGNSLEMTPGTINQRYSLSLFIVQDASEGLVAAGTSNGVINQQAEAAIAAYMARISAGVGWQFSIYTGVASAAQLPTTQTAPRATTAPVPAGGVLPTPGGAPNPITSITQPL
jgi:hypothetical protein